MNRGNGTAIQSRTSRAIESHLQTVGWISRQKTSRLPAEGEVFLLTSLFIELAISECDDPAINSTVLPHFLERIPSQRTIHQLAFAALKYSCFAHARRDAATETGCSALREG